MKEVTGDEAHWSISSLVSLANMERGLKEDCYRQLEEARGGTMKEERLLPITVRSYGNSDVIVSKSQLTTLQNAHAAAEEARMMAQARVDELEAELRQVTFRAEELVTALQRERERMHEIEPVAASASRQRTENAELRYAITQLERANSKLVEELIERKQRAMEFALEI